MPPSLTQAPTTLETQHRFAEILSAEPLCLEDIADKLHPFGRDHEDAVVAVFSEIVECIEEDGVERFRILPEYAIHMSTEIKHGPPYEDKIGGDTASLPAFPSDTISRHDSVSASSASSLSPPLPSPLPQMIEPEFSSPSNSPLSPPPSSSPVPPSPSPSLSSTLSSTLSSPPATPNLRTPSPEPVRPSKKKKAPCSSSKLPITSSSPRTDDDSPKKKRKRVPKKKENMQRIQCSGISKKTKTQCRFQKMVVLGETWDCGRHERVSGGEKKKKGEEDKESVKQEEGQKHQQGRKNYSRIG
ncbi:uncharacterized protein yc1106_08873 [Curvularia clavata]|uniref:Uncharacterized protein n=1 Tax=Curvularia clavata TaxID=95742 RepID=A0A9Q8ZF97_CURCL|nr:uncharacterized protein yc1106_08873 [Curvularia clavata]